MYRPSEHSIQFQRSAKHPANSAEIAWAGIRPRCLREVRRMGFSEADAQDVVQEAMLRAWKSQGQRRGPAALCWVLAITRNEAYRHRGRNRELAELDHAELADEVAAEAPARARARIDLARAAQDLTPEERTLVGMYYGLGFSHSALAHHFGMPEGTVKVRLHRARNKLRLRLATETL